MQSLIPQLPAQRCTFVSDRSSTTCLSSMLVIHPLSSGMCLRHMWCCQNLHLAAVILCCVYSARDYHMYIASSASAYTVCYVACDVSAYLACHVNSGLSRSSAPNPYTSSHAHMPSARRSSSMRADSRNLDHAGQHLLMCLTVLCGIHMLLWLEGVSA